MGKHGGVFRGCSSVKGTGLSDRGKVGISISASIKQRGATETEGALPGAPS